MHRYDAPVGTLAARFVALPHAPACATQVATGSVTHLVRDVVQGKFASAGRELVAMLAPERLNAAVLRLDVGAGALTDEFSDFQFALPSKLSIVAGIGPSGLPGASLAFLPSVIVTDLAGQAVANARVRFAATAPACASLGAGIGTLSNASGIVNDLPWLIGAGIETRVACGRGLAGTDFSGPRSGVNPFQPLSIHLGDPSNGPKITVRTGSVEFVNFGSSGYSSYGPFAQSAAPPAGWPNLTPATSSTIGSRSPFLGRSSICAVTENFNGAASFPENKDIFVTKTITAPVAGILGLTIYIDNDVRVYVDGVNLTDMIPSSTTGAYNATSQFWKHEGCANVGPAVFSIPITAGPHTLAFWARDRGAVGYLDVKVVLNP